MDIRGLNYFVSAVKHLNFTNAAKECNITQTAMSLHVAKMEEELGFQLFKRNRRSMELTKAGKVFYEQILHVMEDYDEAVRQGTDTANGKQGSIKITFPSRFEGMRYLNILNKFKEEHPKIRLLAGLERPADLVNMLRHGDTDVVICWPHDLAGETGVKCVPLGSVEMKIAMDKRHPLANEPEITPAQLKRERYAVIEGKGMPASYRALRSQWLSMGFEPATTIRFHNLDDLLFSLQVDGTVTMLPAYTSSYVGSDFVFKPIANNQPDMPLCAAYLESNPNPTLPMLTEAIKAGYPTICD